MFSFANLFQSKPKSINELKKALFDCVNSNLCRDYSQLIAEASSDPTKIHLLGEKISVDAYSPQRGNYKISSTLLMQAIKHNPPAAAALLQSGYSNPGFLRENGETALYLAIKYQNPSLAMELIRTGESKPEKVTRNGETALIIACKFKMNDVVLALIRTGKSNPGHVDREDYTALLYSIIYMPRNTVLELIRTGKSNPGHVSKFGYTALMTACKNLDTVIAKELLETGASNPSYENNVGESALKIAENRMMTSIVKLIKKQFENVVVNINKTAFDTLAQEDVKISDYLSQSPDNICFSIGEQYYLVNKSEIYRQLNEPDFIKYECLIASDTLSGLLDENIDYRIRYFSVSALFGLQFLVKLDDMLDILDNAEQFYIFQNANKQIPAIISQAVINGGTSVSGDACRTGKPRDVYNINPGIIEFVSRKRGRDDISESTSSSTAMDTDADNSDTNENREKRIRSNIINIQYKGKIYSFDIHDNITIGEIKTLLLNKLVEEGDIIDTNQNVRFIYKGKIYTNDEILLSLLENPPSGLTLQSMIYPKTGGRKTKKRSINKKRKTKRQRQYKSKKGK